MGVGELENHYQGLRVAAPNSHGYTEVVLFVSIDSYSRDVEDGRGIAMIKRLSFPEWKGVEKMILKFIDGRLADYTILYTAGEPDWRSADEFATSLSALLNLPRSWKKQGDSVRVLKCGDINISATVERYSGSSGGILQVRDLNAFRLLQSRVEAGDRQRAEDEEKKRRVFKP
jgi:hypothetical protein